ncbi:DUF488 family protein [Tianweitania sediminis]|uniref:DUF488 domain-containing protein n=1 Tax=Tianweitania sediminis TaxID=1502156 RepID=A0A8J7UIN2_9HYPH|nr:DUF488 domain-containing protein [Tianweitania sediminis]MBP0438000.1 DUF488 domain-containing protein [Tianweitania sediminis]
MKNPFYSVGHSTRSIDAFVRLLGAGRVDFVVDIRTVPRSRTNPQYNTDVLADNLRPYQIGYEHVPELGGLRKRQEMEDCCANAFWTNNSFRNYADYATSEAFQEGLDRLIRRGRGRTIAMMCSEAVWWRCHRRIVADYLLVRGEAVFHLMGDGRADAAKMTPGARASEDGRVIYPAGEAS